MKNMCSLIVTIMVVFTCTKESKSDIILTYLNTTFNSGGTGSIDVLIGSSGTDTLDFFSARFKIEQISGAGVLVFQATQSSSERLSPDYVFKNNLGLGFNSIRDISNSLLLTQFDRAAVNQPIGVGPFLLARLELEHIAPVESTGSYRISLVNDSFTAFRLSTSPIVIDPSSFTNFGTVSITAVPEPSSIALIVVGSTVFAFRQIRRRIKKGSTPLGELHRP